MTDYQLEPRWNGATLPDGWQCKIVRYPGGFAHGQRFKYKVIVGYMVDGVTQAAQLNPVFRKSFIQPAKAEKFVRKLLNVEASRPIPIDQVLPPYWIQREFDDNRDRLIDLVEVRVNETRAVLMSNIMRDLYGQIK